MVFLHRHHCLLKYVLAPGWLCSMFVLFFGCSFPEVRGWSGELVNDVLRTLPAWSSHFFLSFSLGYIVFFLFCSFVSQQHTPYHSLKLMICPTCHLQFAFPFIQIKCLHFFRFMCGPPPIFDNWRATPRILFCTSTKLRDFQETDYRNNCQNQYSIGQDFLTFSPQSSFKNTDIIHFP